MANSKRKGNKFERIISKWFTEFSGFKFQRVPYSGANHQNKDLASDVMCCDERHAHRCKISIECKSYKDIRFEHVLLGNKKCKIIQFWSQACKDAERATKIPILCMRYNSMPKNEFFLVVDGSLADIFCDADLKHIMQIATPDLDGGQIYIFRATEVIKSVNYKDLHKAAKFMCKKLYK